MMLSTRFWSSCFLTQHNLWWGNNRDREEDFVCVMISGEGKGTRSKCIWRLYRDGIQGLRIICSFAYRSLSLWTLSQTNLQASKGDFFLWFFPLDVCCFSFVLFFLRNLLNVIKENIVLFKEKEQIRWRSCFGAWWFLVGSPGLISLDKRKQKHRQREKHCSDTQF